MAKQDLEPTTSKKSIERLDGDLHSVQTFFDEAGNKIHSSANPLMLEIRFKDVCQILVGATALSVPTAYAQEAWTLADELPLVNVIGIVLLSLTLVAFFVYFVFYRGHFRGYGTEFVTRVLVVYVLTFIVSAVVLWLIQKFPITTDPITAIKRAVFVSLPGCFSATVVDSLK